MKQVAQNYKSGELAVLDVPPPSCAPGGVLIRSLYSLISTGTELMKVGEAKLSAAGLVYDGLHTLGNGAILAGMVLGGIGVFLIDRRFVRAAAFCLVGGALSVVGLIHADKVHVFTAGGVALGYLLGAVACLALCLLRVPVRVPDPSDPMDLEAAQEAGYKFDERDLDGRARAPVEKEPVAV